MRKFLTLLLLLTLWSCQSESQNPLKNIQLVTPAGDVIETTIVYTPEEQSQGLSGVKNEDYKANQGMLFFYLEDDEKNFWMPDTYFDLDIIFTDKNLKIVDIIRKLPHYIGRNNQELIPRARPVWSRHALELKADSPISQKLKVGDTLQWKSKLPLEETEKKIREAVQNQSHLNQ